MTAKTRAAIAWLSLLLAGSVGAQIIIQDQAQRVMSRPDGVAHGRRFALGSCWSTAIYCPGYECNETHCDTIWEPTPGATYDTTHAKAYKPIDSSASFVKTWDGRFSTADRIVFATRRHGEIDLDDLIGKIDSVLDGKQRKR